MKTPKKLLGNGKIMLSAMILAASLISCSKEAQDMTPDAPMPVGDEMQASISATATSSNLIFEETFEGSTPLSTVKKHFATTHAFSVVTNPVFDGKKAAIWELRDSDPLNNDGTRAELSFPPLTTELNRWYSFAVYFPAATYQKDASDDCISQWHQLGGYSPSLSFRTKLDRFMLVLKPTPKTTEKIDLGAMTKDSWNNFVFHIKHSSGSDGLVEIWLNGKKIFTRNGINMYPMNTPGVKMPQWKMGIYKSDWNGAQTTDTKIRLFYYDNIRMGNSNATYADMSKVGSSTTPINPPPPPPPASSATSPVTGLILLSAHTEKDIMAIANGASISLATVGVPKLNLRATTAGTVGSVKLEVSGTESKTVIDNLTPFSLNGDDGNGNFYYGNWYPPKLGTYTIKATSYSGPNATGTAGTPYTIQFTFVK
jgi:hypothetical protein